MLEMIGGPDRDRTDDLFHAIPSIACNLMILGASVATKSILEHPKPTLSTFASTFKKSKEEVCDSIPSRNRVTPCEVALYARFIDGKGLIS